MNSTLRRVAGGRSAKLHLIPRRNTYTTAAIISDERVRRAVERAAAQLKTPDHDQEILRAQLHSRDFLPPAPEAYERPEKDPQLGDYPVLPWISNQELPANGWWDPQLRRNYGDPIHEYDEVLSMWGPDVSVVDPHRALFQFSLAVLGFVGFGFLCKYALVPDKPAVPREYPFSGLVVELGGLEENKAREEEIEMDE